LTTSFKRIPAASAPTTIAICFSFLHFCQQRKFSSFFIRLRFVIHKHSIALILFVVNYFLFIFFFFLHFLLFFSPKLFVINKKERIALSFQFIIYTITRVYSSNSSCAFSDASSVITAVTFFKEQIEVKSSLPILEESISR